MSLGLSFQRDVLYTAAKLLRCGDMIYRFLYWRECLVNDVGDSPCHFATPCHILYDVFYITACQCQYVTYWCGNVGGNCITGKMVENGSICWCKKVSRDIPGKIPLHIYIKKRRFVLAIMTIFYFLYPLLSYRSSIHVNFGDLSFSVCGVHVL